MIDHNKTLRDQIQDVLPLSAPVDKKTVVEESVLKEEARTEQPAFSELEKEVQLTEDEREEIRERVDKKISSKDTLNVMLDYLM